MRKLRCLEPIQCKSIYRVCKNSRRTDVLFFICLHSSKFVKIRQISNTRQFVNVRYCSERYFEAWTERNQRTFINQEQMRARLIESTILLRPRHLALCGAIDRKTLMGVELMSILRMPSGFLGLCCRVLLDWRDAATAYACPDDGGTALLPTVEASPTALRGALPQHDPRLTLERTAEQLRVECADIVASLPAHRDAALNSGSGLGLLLRR